MGRKPDFRKFRGFSLENFAENSFDKECIFLGMFKRKIR